MSKTLKVFMTSDFKNDYDVSITAVIIATSEEDARHEFEKALKLNNVSLTDRFGIPKPYTMDTVKMHKPSVHILSYGEP